MNMGNYQLLLNKIAGFQHGSGVKIVSDSCSWMSALV